MPNGPITNGGRNQIALWSVIGAVMTGLIAWFSIVEIAQKPLEERMASNEARINAAIAESGNWRRDFSAQMAQENRDILSLTEERRIAMLQRLTEIDTGYGVTIGELARRIANIEQDRAKVVGEAVGTLARIQDRLDDLGRHILALDARLSELEDAVQVLGSAITQRQPDPGFGPGRR